MLEKTNNFWVQLAVALVLALAITIATVAAAPTSVLDRATAAVGHASEVLAGEDDGADEQARGCWFTCRR